MKKLSHSILLAFLLLITPLGRLARGQHLTTDTAKIKAEILKRGTGEKSSVTIVLRNGSQLKGRITATSDNMFTLREEKTRGLRDIGFTGVLKVKGRGLSRGAKFGIFTAIITGAVVIGALMSLKNVDPFKDGVLR